MKIKLLVLALLCSAILAVACAAPPRSDPAEFITLNKQRELQLLGSWKLTELKDGHAPQPNEAKTLTFANDGTLKMDLWEHQLTFKYEVTPDPDHLRLTWVASTNPNDKPGAVLTQELVVNTDDLMLDGDQYKRVALASGATLTPAPIVAMTPLPTESGPQRIETQLGAPVTLHVQQTAVVTDSPDKFGLTFYAVAQDSRCPQSVTCVQVGEARIQVTFEENGLMHPPVLELSTSPASSKNNIEIEGYDVALVELAPERKTPDPIPPEEYAATFVITKTLPTLTPTLTNTTPFPTTTPVAVATPIALQTAHLDQPFTIGMSNVFEIPEAQLRVYLTTLREESRCPKSVNCVQAGRALLAFTLERNNKLGIFALSTSPPDGRTRAYFQGYVLELQDVQPYPQAPEPKIPLQDYRATVVVKQAPAPTTNVHKNEPLVLKLGQSAQLADEDVRVTFVRVQSDSRCPVMGMCATSGNAVVEVTLEQPDGTVQTFVLNSDSRTAGQRIPDTGSYGMELVALTPYPRADFASKDIAPEEYVATLVVKKFG